MPQPFGEAPQSMAPGDGVATWLAGALITTRLPGELTGNALAITEHLLPPGFATPPHRHHVEDEILYVLEGEIAACCEDAALRGGPGALLFLPRGLTHSWSVAGDSPARLLVVTTPAGYERFCAEAGHPALARTLPPTPPEPTATAPLRAVAIKYGLEYE